MFLYFSSIWTNCFYYRIPVTECLYQLKGTLQEKPYFLFPNFLKRWSFQKKSGWNMIFLLSSGKMIFLFPQNMILLFRRKMKDDISQKKTTTKTKHGNMIHSSNVPKIWSFLKNCTFLYHEERWHFFFPKV